MKFCMMLRGISKRIRPMNFVHVFFKMVVMRLHFFSNFLKFTQKLQIFVLFISSKGAYNGNEAVRSYTLFNQIWTKTADIPMLEAQNIGKITKRSFELFLGMSLYTCRGASVSGKETETWARFHTEHAQCWAVKFTSTITLLAPHTTQQCGGLGRYRETGILLLPETFKSEHAIIIDRGWKMLVLWYVSTTTI